MKNHGHKEPPLHAQVNHKSRLKSKIEYYVVMTLLVLICSYTFASVFGV